MADRVAPPTTSTTGTKIYVNLAMPDFAEAVAAQDVDGVGLLRAEFMLTKRSGGGTPMTLSPAVNRTLRHSDGRPAVGRIPPPSHPVR